MRKLAVFTLASSGEKCLIDRNNIAFVLKLASEVEGEQITFSRVFLKALAMNGEETFVDVKETLDEIRKKGR